MAGLRQQGSQNRRRWFSHLLYVLSLILLGFGLVSLGWAVWPVPTDARTFTIPAGTLPGTPSGETFSSLADYVLQVSWSRWIRAGEAGEILLTLSEVDSTEDKVLERETQVVLVEPTVASLPVKPPGRTQVNLGPGQDMRQTWTVQGAIAGEYPGKLVVSFGFYDTALNEIVPVPVAVVDMTIQVVTLWGLARGLVLWLGLVGLVLWGALFILGRVVEGDAG
ncbi:MAG: hypothetical protein ACOCYU_07495 [Brevefilum sp.]